MSLLESMPIEALATTLSSLEYCAIVTLCRTNKRFTTLLTNNDFWIYRFQSEHSDITLDEQMTLRSSGKPHVTYVTLKYHRWFTAHTGLSESDPIEDNYLIITALREYLNEETRSSATLVLLYLRETYPGAASKLFTSACGYCDIIAFDELIKRFLRDPRDLYGALECYLTVRQMEFATFVYDKIKSSGYVSSKELENVLIKLMKTSLYFGPHDSVCRWLYSNLMSLGLDLDQIASQLSPGKQQMLFATVAFYLEAMVL